MRKRFIALILAVVAVLAIPVAVSAQESEEARPERAPVAIDERFDTVEEAVAAITERLTNALERLTGRYESLQENEDVPDDALAHMETVIDHVGETLAAVADADDFEELQTVLDAAREQRREDRANRPYRPCRHRHGPGAGQPDQIDAEA